MAGALDDALAEQPLFLERRNAGSIRIRVERLDERRSIVRGLGDAGGDMRPRDEGGIADDAARSKARGGSRDRRSAAERSSISRTIARTAAPAVFRLSAHLAMASRRMSVGGIEIAWVTPLSSVKSEGSSLDSSAGRYHMIL